MTRPIGPCVHRSEYEVRDVDLATAEELVKFEHYAKGGSNTATFLHGLFRRDNFLKCLGVAWWLPPTKAAAQANWHGDPHRVLSLSRLALLPEVPTNGESFLIGESIRRIKRDGRYDCLLTYADKMQGHKGAIYLATNWKPAGETNAEPVFHDSSGRMVSRKAGPKTRTRRQMESLGYTMIGTSSKLRFRFILREVTR